MINMISGAAHIFEGFGMPYGAAALMVLGFGSLAGLAFAVGIIRTIQVMSER